MTTDNRTSEQLSGNTGQFTEAMVEAAAKIIRRASLETTADPGDFWSDCYEGEREAWRNVARAALVAAQGAAPQADSDDSPTPGNNAPVLPSSGVDVAKIESLIMGRTATAGARAVADWLKDGAR